MAGHAVYGDVRPVAVYGIDLYNGAVVQAALYAVARACAGAHVQLAGGDHGIRAGGHIVLGDPAGNAVKGLDSEPVAGASVRYAFL